LVCTPYRLGSVMECGICGISSACSCCHLLHWHSTAMKDWNFIKLSALPSAIPPAVQHIFFSGSYFKNIIPSTNARPIHIKIANKSLPDMAKLNCCGLSVLTNQNFMLEEMEEEVKFRNACRPLA